MLDDVDIRNPLKISFDEYVQFRLNDGYYNSLKDLVAAQTSTQKSHRGYGHGNKICELKTFTARHFYSSNVIGGGVGNCE